jgi:PQQ-like domain
MRTFRGLLGVGIASCVVTGCLLMMGAGEAMALPGGTLAATSLVEQPFAVTDVESAEWSQLGYGPDRTGYQPDETTIGPGNVGSLTAARTYATGGSPSPPLIVDGILYADKGNQLQAFDATGMTDCSTAPVKCTPLWTAATAYFDGMAIANGEVFVTDGEGVQAFDAAGSTDCSGTPTVCSPLWATSTHEDTGPAFAPGSGSPVVANGVLYVPGYGDGLALASGGAYVSAFDAAGSSDCTGSPKVCVPMWTTTGLPTSAGNIGSPSISDGVLYIANGTLFAFDAAGSTDCSGTPTVCAPLWTASISSGPTYAAPSVANGTVFVSSWSGTLYAFDAAGSTNCSTSADVTTCTPLWTATGLGSIGGRPAVANGVVYVESPAGLSAFDAAGSTNCSGAVTERTCAPLWGTGADDAGDPGSSPAVANGVVYVSSIDGGTQGYDAAGTADCSTTKGVTTCAPLWSAVSGFIGGGSPAVVNGVVYINVSGNGTIYAYTPGQALTATSTRLSGGGQSGASISVPEGTAVSDTASVSGTNASTATGTVTYSVYSDSGCTTAVSTGTAQSITTPGTLPASSPVALSDPGTYYWQASYSGDSANAPSVSACGSEVEIVRSPPSVVTGVASSVTPNSLTLNATVNPNGTEVSDCHFEYGTTTLYGSSAPCTTLPGSGNSAVAVAAPVGSLASNTTYHFRIVAANPGGTSYGVDETFATPLSTQEEAAITKKHEEEAAAKKKEESGVLGAKEEMKAPATGSISLDGSTISVESNHEAAVRLTCTGTATCAGKLTLTVKVTTGKGTKKHTKTETIGTATFSVATGQTEAIKLTLNGTGRGLLSAAHGQLGATLTILTSSPSPSKTRTENVHLVLQKAKKSKK